MAYMECLGIQIVVESFILTQPNVHVRPQWPALGPAVGRETWVSPGRAQWIPPITITTAAYVATTCSKQPITKLQTTSNN